MHYEGQRGVLGEPLKEEPTYLDEDFEEVEPPLSKEAITEALFNAGHSASWHLMFPLQPQDPLQWMLHQYSLCRSKRVCNCIGFVVDVVLIFQKWAEGR
jgi:hypothetical protein